MSSLTVCISSWILLVPSLTGLIVRANESKKKKEGEGEEEDDYEQEEEEKKKKDGEE